MRVPPDQSSKSPDERSPDVADLLHHDTRAALADVLGGLELLSDAVLEPDARTQLDRVRAAARQLARLQEFARFQADRSGSGQGQSLIRLIDGVRARWEGRAQQSGVSLTSDIILPDTAGSALSPLALERVLGNLLENALKYGEGQPVHLRARADTEAGTVLITVTDAGPGVPPEDRRTVLSAGKRAGNVDLPGSGWGLHIAHDLVVRAGGALALGDARHEAAPGRAGRGLKVSITLPLVSGLSEPAPAPDDDAPLAGARVLLVEDNPTNQLVAQKMLSLLGADCVLCNDGVEATDVLGGQDFDIALIDIEMPRKDGLTLIAELRDHPDRRIATIPRVAVTAYAMPHHRAAILDAGAQGVIEKPLADIDAFGAEVRKFLRPRRPRAIPPEMASKLGGMQDMLGDAGFMDWVKHLQTDLARAQRDLHAGMQGADWDRIRSGAHAMVALAGMVGAQAAQSAAAKLQQRAEAGEAAPTAQDADILSLLDQIASVESFLETYRSDMHPE